MAKKTVITKVLDAESQDGMILIPQGKPVWADQFTDDAPNTDEQREGFQAESMDAAFGHYKPHKDITLVDEAGGDIRETFEFTSILDFEDRQLIEKSEHLRTEQGKIDALDKVICQLERNKTLRNVLQDENARRNFYQALKAVQAEIENQN